MYMYTYTYIFSTEVTHYAEEDPQSRAHLEFLPPLPAPPGAACADPEPFGPCQTRVPDTPLGLSVRGAFGCATPKKRESTRRMG